MAYSDYLKSLSSGGSAKSTSPSSTKYSDYLKSLSGANTQSTPTTAIATDTTSSQKAADNFANAKAKLRTEAENKYGVNTQNTAISSVPTTNQTSVANSLSTLPKLSETPEINASDSIMKKYNLTQSDLYTKDAMSYDKRGLKKKGLSDDEINTLINQDTLENQNIGLENTKTFADKHPVLSTLLSFPMQLGTGIGNVADTVVNALSGKKLSNNDNGAYLQNVVDTTRGTVTNNIDSKVGQTAYNAANSIGDMALNVLLPTGSLGMAAEKASETRNEAVERGLTDKQVLEEMAASGLTTAITEKIPMGKIKKIAETGFGEVGKTTLKEVAKKLGALYVSEDVQEMSEDVADIIADRLIAKDKNQIANEINYYKGQGYSDEEAKKKVFWDNVKRVVLDGVIGGVSAGVLGGAAGIVGNIRNRTNTNTNTTEAVPTVDQSFYDERRANTERNFEDLINQQRAMLNQEEVARQNEAINNRINEEANANNQVNLGAMLEEARNMPNPEVENFNSGANYIESILNISENADDLAKFQRVRQYIDTINNPDVTNEGYKNSLRRVADVTARQIGDYNARNYVLNYLNGTEYNQYADIPTNPLTENPFLSFDDTQEDLYVPNLDPRISNRTMAESTGLGKSNNAGVEDSNTLEFDFPMNENVRANIDAAEAKVRNANQAVDRFYTNSMPRSEVLTADQITNNTDVNDFTHTVSNESQLRNNAIASVNADINAVENDVLNKNGFTDQDIHNAFVAAQTDTNVDNKVKLLQKISKELSRSGQNLRADQEYIGVERSFLDTLREINKKTDESRGLPGFSDSIDNLLGEIENIVNNGGSIDDVMNKLRSLKDNLSEYANGDLQKAKLKKSKARGLKEAVDNIEKGLKENKEKSQLVKEAKDFIKNQNGVVNLSDEQLNEIYNELQQIEGIADPKAPERVEAMNRIAKMIDIAAPSSIPNSIKTVLYDNMLAGLKTIITRNFFGNFFNAVTDAIEHPVATIVDKAVSKKTNQHAYALDNKGMVEYAKAFSNAINTQTEQIKSSLKETFNKNSKANEKKGTYQTRTGEDSLGDYIEAVHTEYKWDNKLSKFFRGYDTTVRQLMQLGDRPFYEAAYAYRKNELQKIVSKYGEDAIAYNPTGVPAEVATNVDTLIEFLSREAALEACMQNNSLTTQSLVSIKDGVNKLSRSTLGVDVLSQVAMPFVQVSGNQLERTLQHTPIGIIGNTIKTISEVSNNSFNQQRFSKETARNLVGSLLIVGATELAKAGFISGAFSDDKDEKKAQQAQGYQEYAIQNPDGSFQMDLSNTGMLGAIAEMGGAYKNARENGSSLAGALLNSQSQGIKSAISDSALQGLDIITSLSGDNNATFNNGDDVEKAKQMATDLSTSLASQFIPQIIRNTASYSDDYKRDLGQYGSTDYYINSLKNQIPGLRQTLPVKYDNEGNPILNHQGDQGALKVAEDYILPYNISRPQYTDLTQEAMRLNQNPDLTKSASFVPSDTKNDVINIKGYDKENYEYEDLYNFRVMAGEKRNELGEAVIKSTFYKGLSDEEKNNVLGDVYSAAKSIAKEEFVRDQYPNREIPKLEAEDKIYKSDSKLVKAYELGGTNYMISYLKAVNDYGGALNSSPYKWVNSLDSFGSDKEKGKFIANFTADSSLTKEAKDLIANRRYAELYNYYVNRAREEAEKQNNN